MPSAWELTKSTTPSRRRTPGTVSPTRSPTAGSSPPASPGRRRSHAPRPTATGRPPHPTRRAERTRNGATDEESMPGPVAIAAQTSSAEAAPTATSRSSHACPISGLLVLSAVRQPAVQRRMNGDDDAKLSSTLDCVVVVLADKPCHRVRELLGEGGPVGSRGEPHLTVERKCGYPLARPGGPGDQGPHIADQPSRDGKQPARGEPVR